MLKDKDEILRLSDNLCSMVFSDLQKFVNNLLIDGDLTIIEVAELLDINANDVYKILHNELPDVTLKTYLRVLVASELTLDVHSLKAPYNHSSGKSKYDNIENGLNERQKKELAELLGISTADVEKFIYVHSNGKSKYGNLEKNLDVQLDQKLSNEELAYLLGVSVVDVQNFLYDYANDKIKYNNIEKELYEKKNAFLDALKESKPDSKYLQELRELAKTNADNKKLCELIKYYTD